MEPGSETLAVSRERIKQGRCGAGLSTQGLTVRSPVLPIVKTLGGGVECPGGEFEIFFSQR